MRSGPRAPSSGPARPATRAPERTCIGCGGKAGCAALIRLVVAAGGAVSVDRGRSGGRGAWLHPAPACLERALKRKAFARAFRRQVAVDGEALRGQLTGSCRKD
ncbi:MAG TPA: YlxR family protein [Anaeromyxobacteraceae bacterium]|jgi:hypothetical protein|nr:YlxR family protein [Anaeromyxobacteraceae bacterium]